MCIRDKVLRQIDRGGVEFAFVCVGAVVVEKHLCVELRGDCTMLPRISIHNKSPFVVGVILLQQLSNPACSVLNGLQGRRGEMNRTYVPARAPSSCARSPSWRTTRSRSTKGENRLEALLCNLLKYLLHNVSIFTENIYIH